VLSDDTAAALKDAIEEFKKGFETSAGELLVTDEPAEPLDPDKAETEKVRRYTREPEGGSRQQAERTSEQRPSNTVAPEGSSQPESEKGGQAATG
jgi:hypothetical protein